METQKKPLSFKILNVFIQLAFWLFSALMLLFIIFSIVSIFTAGQKNINLHLDLPIEFNSHETGTIDLFGETYSVKLVESIGRIRFDDAPVSVIRWIMLYLVPIFAMIFYILFTLRKFIMNVNRMNIFDAVNIRHLKHIAYGFMALWLIVKVYGLIIYLSIGQNIHFETLDFTGNINFKDNGLLILALFVWVLSHIFGKGKQLQDEQSLTI